MVEMFRSPDAGLDRMHIIIRRYATEKGQAKPSIGVDSNQLPDAPWRLSEEPKTAVTAVYYDRWGELVEDEKPKANSDPIRQAELILKLYELRREAVMNEARSYVGGKFMPQAS
jgi:hypothetical protein